MVRINYLDVSQRLLHHSIALIANQLWLDKNVDRSNTLYNGKLWSPIIPSGLILCVL